jgi:hypothetical protein
MKTGFAQFWDLFSWIGISRTCDRSYYDFGTTTSSALLTYVALCRIRLVCFLSFLGIDEEATVALEVRTPFQAFMIYSVNRLSE